MTNAYIYQAALLCEDCARHTRQQIDVTGAGKPKPGFSQDDSDLYPQGPYKDGGGEADSPQHCDDCGIFLENPLTPDGEEYVRNLAKPFETRPDMSWDEIAVASREGDKPVLADWIIHYFAWGR